MPAADPAPALVTALRDALAPRRGRVAPAQAWGVFDRDGLIHAEGWGAAAADPAGTAFRIASCTKSVTAAVALTLVDEGLLGLDEPLAEALDVPLRFVGDGVPTVEDALAMRTGLPTDDPWADRQESLSAESFRALLAAGVRAQRPAGSRYEYSNLGYAIVGRIVEARAGRGFRDIVAERILRPAGLAATGFTADVPAPGGVVTGYRPGPDSWEPLAFSGPGAFSPIGGLFSTVGDLAAWCRALARDDGPPAPGIAAAMRLARTAMAGEPGGPGPWAAYGLGLVVRDDGAGHRFLAHSGGYPGFSSHMAWEQGSGVGAIVLENATYTEVAVPVRAAFDEVFGSAPPPAAAPETHGGAWPETMAAAERLRDELAGGGIPSVALLDPCVELDEPIPRRLARLAADVERIGGVRSVEPSGFDTPASASWTMTGPRGRIRCGIAMTPLDRPLVQRIDIVRDEEECG